MDIFSLAEITGYGAFLLTLIGFLFKCPRVCMIYFMAAAGFWTIHFTMTGEASGAWMSALAAVRNLGGAFFNDKWMKKTTSAFLLAGVVLTLSATQYLYDFLPFAAYVLASYATFVRDKPLLFRSAYFANNASWLVYGLCIASFSLMLNSVVLMGFVVAAILRYDLNLTQYFVTKRGVAERSRQVP